MKQKTITDYLLKFPENIRSFIVTGILSLAAALSAVGFLYSIHFIFEHTYQRFATESKLYFVIASFLLIVSTSFVVGLLLNVFSKEAAGSGIPQVKAAYWKELGFLKFKPVLVKFVAGVLSIAGGNSLGREGPSVYLGSGVASQLDGVFGASRKQRRGAALIGASAGLAAAFNTPLAAITFVIEEIVGDMNNKYLGRVVISSVIGAFVVYALLGRQPAFSLPSIENISWFHYLVVPFVAFFASFGGAVFQKLVLFCRTGIKKQKRIPVLFLPLIGGLITWVIGVSVFLLTGKIGIFSLGYEDLSQALNNDFPWEIAGFMACAKLLATAFSYSFGGCGGIFAPSLFVGGLSGYFVAGLASNWIPLTPADFIVLAAVGMSSYLGAVVRAPLTSILIVFEMTHQFALVPGLMIGIIISQTIAHALDRFNFYDAILIQDGHELHKIRPPLDLYGWQSLSISAIANPKPIGLTDFAQHKMKDLLEKYPYAVFPVFTGNLVKGAVTRQELEQAVKENRSPEVQEMGYCFCDETVREVGNRFVESAVQVLIVLDRKTQAIKGIITMHDLIRAQVAQQD